MDASVRELPGYLQAEPTIAARDERDSSILRHDRAQATRWPSSARITATIAVLTHHGGYDTIAGTYQRRHLPVAGRWVAERATYAEAPVRESYVTGPTETDDPASYRTDTCWPLATDTSGGPP